MATINMPLAIPSPNNCNNKEKPFSCWLEIFDPKSKFINNCNHFLLFVALFGLYIDPYYYYLPRLDDSGSLDVDLQLGVSVSYFRMFGDFLLFWGMVLRFRTGYEARPSHVFRNRELVKDPKFIAFKYFKSCFFIDFLASLPLPQVYLGYHILVLETFQATDIYYYLTKIVGAQFYVRVLATLVVYMKIEKSTGIAIKNPWSGTLYILFVYEMLSHFLGAVYYDLYIVELQTCRDLVVQTVTKATMPELDILVAKCSQKNESDQLGLLSDAFANNIGSRKFLQRFMFCFSWGFKTLRYKALHFDHYKPCKLGIFLGLLYTWYSTLGECLVVPF